MTPALAHVAGLPVEELLLPALPLLGGAVLALRSWLGSRLHHHPAPTTTTDPAPRTRRTTHG